MAGLAITATLIPSEAMSVEFAGGVLESQETFLGFFEIFRMSSVVKNLKRQSESARDVRRIDRRLKRDQNPHGPL
jgi:hypothetical protein